MTLLSADTDPEPRLIVLFDTDCVLCAAWVRFILRHERRPEARFASTRSAVGQALAARHGIAPAMLDVTYVVIRDGRALIRSEASLALLRDLRAPWCWLALARWVPRRLRDGVYDRVARNRLRLFGQRDACFLPRPEQRGRFLDGYGAKGP